MYDEVLLTKLFEINPRCTDFEDEYCWNFEYRKGRGNFELVLDYSPYHEHARIRLEYKNIEIYSVSLRPFGEIRTGQHGFQIFEGCENPAVIQVLISPDFVSFPTQITLDYLQQKKIKKLEKTKGLIKYDDLQLLILFSSEPIASDNQRNVFEYSLKDAHGFEFSFCFAVYEQWVSAKLMYQKQQVYKIDLTSVTDVRVEKDQLKIFREDREEPFIKILVRPDFTSEASFFSLDVNL